MVVLTRSCFWQSWVCNLFRLFVCFLFDFQHTLYSVVPDLSSFGGYLISRGLEESEDAQIFRTTQMLLARLCGSTSLAMADATPIMQCTIPFLEATPTDQSKRKKRATWSIQAIS